MAEPAEKNEGNEETRQNDGGQANARFSQGKRQYAVIRFTGKIKPSDPPLVSVRINGKQMRMKRKVYIPVTAAVVSVLRDATEPIAEADDGSGQLTNIRRRKVVDFSPRFPFELYGWINAEAYRKLHGISLKREITEEELQEAL